MGTAVRWNGGSTKPGSSTSSNASTESGSAAARAGKSHAGTDVAADPTPLWTKGVVPGLEHRLEHQDDAPEQ
jgi:hypothetical protein